MIAWNNKSLSKFCLGTAQLGMPYGIANKSGMPNSAEITKMIRVAFENGVNLFDTAQAYGDSELRLGNAFRELSIDDYVSVITKITPSLERKDERAIFQSVEKSIRNLGIRRLFSVMLHREEWLEDWESHYKKPFQNLIRAGLTETVGVSIYSMKAFDRALEIDQIKTIQMPFNIFDQRVRVYQCCERALEKGKLLFLRSVYLQGALSLNSDEIPNQLLSFKDFFSKFLSVSSELGLEGKDLALKFAAEHSPNAVVVIGAETVSQIEHNLKVLDDGYSSLNQNEVLALGDNVPETLINPALWKTN